MNDGFSLAHLIQLLMLLKQIPADALNHNEGVPMQRRSLYQQERAPSAGFGHSALTVSRPSMAKMMPYTSGAQQQLPQARTAPAMTMQPSPIRQLQPSKRVDTPLN